MKTLYESILDDEDELIDNTVSVFKNWVAFVSCMYFEKNWNDDKILEYLNSKSVMSFFPSLKGYKWKVFDKSGIIKRVHYVLQDDIDESIAVKLELLTNKVELQIGCKYFEGRELAKLKRRLEKDCKMKYTYTSNNFGQLVIYYSPRNDYWKDWDSFK